MEKEHSVTIERENESIKVSMTECNLQDIHVYTVALLQMATMLLSEKTEHTTNEIFSAITREAQQNIAHMVAQRAAKKEEEAVATTTEAPAMKIQGLEIDFPAPNV